MSECRNTKFLRRNATQCRENCGNDQCDGRIHANASRGVNLQISEWGVMELMGYVRGVNG